MNIEHLIKTRENIEHIGYSEYYETPMLHLCMDLTIHIQGTRRQNEEAIQYFYEKSLELAGKNFSFSIINQSGKVRKITKKSSAEFSTWFEKDAPDDDSNYGIYFKSGEKPAEAGRYVLNIARLFAYPLHLQLQVPVQYIIDHGTQEWIELVIKMTDRLHILTGYSGFGTARSPGLNNTQFEDGPIYKITRRYPAVDEGSLTAFEEWLTPCPMRWKEAYIKRINWLTFLDMDKINRLGGSVKLNKTLTEGEVGKGIIIHQLQHGIMIQAGPEPELGDVNRPDTLQYYYRVGKILKPLRIPDEWLEIYDGIGGNENTKRWLGYFDESK